MEFNSQIFWKYLCINRNIILNTCGNTSDFMCDLFVCLFESCFRTSTLFTVPKATLTVPNSTTKIIAAFLIRLYTEENVQHPYDLYSHVYWKLKAKVKQYPYK